MQLTQRMLTGGVTRRVEQYRVEREALRTELRGELARTKDQAPEVRRQALEACAREQEARLVRLEAQAEEMRSDFRMSNLGWGDQREWGLSVPEPRGFTLQETAVAMRAAAFYFPHLSAAQRGLLREIAYELAQADATAFGSALKGPYLSNPGSYRVFSPELGRIRIPPDLNAEASAAWAAYEERKARLKKELYDTVAAIDKPALSLRGNAELRALAARQIPELAALEEDAERFRRALPPHYGLEAAPYTLPVALATRAADLNQALSALRVETGKKVDALKASYKSRLSLSPPI